MACIRLDIHASCKSDTPDISRCLTWVQWCVHFTLKKQTKTSRYKWSDISMHNVICSDANRFVRKEVVDLQGHCTWRRNKLWYTCFQAWTSQIFSFSPKHNVIGLKLSLYHQNRACWENINLKLLTECREVGERFTEAWPLITLNSFQVICIRFWSYTQYWPLHSKNGSMHIIPRVCSL